MNRKNIFATVIFSFIVLCLCSCGQEKFSGKNKKLTNRKLYAVTFSFHDRLKGITQVNNTQRVEEIANSLNNAEVAGERKAMNWDTITIEGSRLVLVLYSDGKVFSDVNSGTFYTLDDELKKYWP
jgi:hypothetical protein